MALTKEQKRDYQREYMKKKRSNKEGLTATEILDPPVGNLLDPPAILAWLIPGTKREKLGCILEQFGKRKPLLECTYICGIPLDEVTELYEVTG